MKNLLHVDDDETWRHNFTEVADDLGLNLKQFSSRDEALAAIREERPDIVITDLHLGKGELGERVKDQSGYDVARAAKEAGVPNISIASSTGTPSQKIEGVIIQEKGDALKWLGRLVRGGPEQG